MKKTFFTLLISFTSFVLSYSQVSRNGLVAVYKFDGNYNDSTPNKRHALWANTTLISDRNNNSNSAIEFNGDDGFVTSYIGSHTNLTIAFWCKPYTQVDPYPHFWDYGDYKYRGMIMAGSIYNSSDRNRIYSGSNFPNEVFTKSASTITYNQWQHIAFVFDKTNNKIQIYIDGSLSSETTISSSLSPTDSTIMFGRLKTGAATNITTSNYKGAMDDIYIFNRALSAQDVADLKDGNVSTLGVPHIGDNTNPSEDILIYPNPTNTSISVQVNNDALKINSIKVFDTNGKMVLIGYQQNQLDVSNLASGTYIIQVTDDKNRILKTDKIVKR